MIPAIANAATPVSSRDDEANRFTPRETDVLILVVQGSTNKVIAHRLGISERCVKWHLTNIYRKAAVESRAQAVAWVLAKWAREAPAIQMALRREAGARDADECAATLIPTFGRAPWPRS